MARVVAVLSVLSSTATATPFANVNGTLLAEYARRLAPPRNAEGKVELRRLGGPGGHAEPTPECMAACPGLQDLMEAMAPMESMMEGAGEMDMESGMDAMMEMMTGMGYMTGCMFETVCKHKDVIKCVSTSDQCAALLQAEQNATAQNPDDKMGDTMSFTKLGQQADCMCDACPEMIEGMAGVTVMAGQITIKMMEALAGMGQEGPTTTASPEQMKREAEEMMKGVCPLVGAMECASESAVCAAVMEVDSFQGLSMLTGGRKKDAATQTAELKASCAAIQVATTRSTRQFTCAAFAAGPDAWMSGTSTVDPDPLSQTTTTSTTGKEEDSSSDSVVARGSGLVLVVLLSMTTL